MQRNIKLKKNTEQCDVTQFDSLRMLWCSVGLSNMFLVSSCRKHWPCCTRTWNSRWICCERLVLRTERKRNDNHGYLTLHTLINWMATLCDSYTFSNIRKQRKKEFWNTLIFSVTDRELNKQTTQIRLKHACPHGHYGWITAFDNLLQFLNICRELHVVIMERTKGLEGTAHSLVSRQGKETLELVSLLTWVYF